MSEKIAANAGNPAHVHSNTHQEAGYASGPLPSYVCGLLYGKPIFEGGCGKLVSFEDSYRCSDCTASFHRDCIREHFRLSNEIGDCGHLTLKDVLIECLSWMSCECGHPACKRCLATREARDTRTIHQLNAFQVAKIHLKEKQNSPNK